MGVESKVFKVLEELSIGFEEYHHPPVYTVEEADKYWKDIQATHCKNLFFRDKKGRNHYLLIAEYNKQVDISKFGQTIEAGRLSFASPERLQKHLGLSPGSVSPFGLINDSGNEVVVFVDEDLKTAERVGFHPNKNSITIVLGIEDFVKYLEWTGNTFGFVKI